MSSIRHAFAAGRAFSTSSRALLPPARYAFAARSNEQRGDPGPRTAQSRLSRRPSAFNASDRPTRTDDFARPRASPRGGPTRGPRTAKEVSPPKPWLTSQALRKLIADAPSPMTEKAINDAIALVFTAPPGSTNAPVWNLLLSTLGREGKMDKMYRYYVEMKKRGIKPTSRTYTVMINAYAGVNHSGSSAHFRPGAAPSSMTQSRVSSLYDLSQQHIRECISAHAKTRLTSPKDLGLFRPGAILEEDVDPTVPATDESEISLGPTNSYLKYLTRYGLWTEVDRLFNAMDTQGPLAPDSITYSTILLSLINRDLPPNEHGPKARAIVERAVVQFYPSSGAKVETRTHRIDSELAVICLSALLRGRPDDRQLATDLLPYLYNLPPVGSEAQTAPPATTSPQASPKTRYNADKLPAMYLPLPLMHLNPAAATTILSALSRAEEHTLASHYAEQFLAQPKLLPKIDHPFLYTAIRSFSITASPRPIKRILDTFRPPPPGSGDNWPGFVWDGALGACRWKGEWESALSFFRRMTHLPHGAEKGEKERKYVWKAPNGSEVDVQGMRWIPPRPRAPGAKQMSLLMKTALCGGGKTQFQEAWRIFRRYDEQDVFWQIGDREWGGELDVDMLRNGDEQLGLAEGKDAVRLAREVEWRAELALDVVRVTDGLRKVEDAAPGVDMQEVEKTAGKMRGIVARWREVRRRAKDGAKSGGARERVAVDQGQRRDDGSDGSSARAKKPIILRPRPFRERAPRQVGDGQGRPGGRPQMGGQRDTQRAGRTASAYSLTE